MGLFRRKSPPFTEHVTLSPADMTPNIQEVLETIEQLEIPPHYLIIMGGGALTLSGYPRRASDVDGVLHPDFHRQVVADGHLPNGIPVEPSGTGPINQNLGHLVAAPNRTTLPAEFIRNFGGVFEQVPFDELYEHSNVVEGVHVLGHDDLIYANRKMRQNFLRTPEQRHKDAYDGQLLYDHTLRQYGHDPTELKAR